MQIGLLHIADLTRQLVLAEEVQHLGSTDECAAARTRTGVATPTWMPGDGSRTNQLEQAMEQIDHQNWRAVDTPSRSAAAR